jgi:hypothetical protein
MFSPESFDELHAGLRLVRDRLDGRDHVARLVDLDELPREQRDALAPDHSASPGYHGRRETPPRGAA